MTSSGKVSLFYHASAACRGCPHLVWTFRPCICIVVIFLGLISLSQKLLIGKDWSECPLLSFSYI